MTSPQCILLASLNPDLLPDLMVEVDQRPCWQLAGPINPRDFEEFARACEMADVILIEAEDLLWLWEHQPDRVLVALLLVCVVVILPDHLLLAVTTRVQNHYGLLLRSAAARPPINRISLAMEGYVVFPKALLQRIASNQLRLEIVADFSPDLLQTLALLGAALSNRNIAEVSGMTESRVKTLVHIATRRLCMNNRTAVAVFATTNGMAHVIEAQPQG